MICKINLDSSKLQSMWEFRISLTNQLLNLHVYWLFPHLECTSCFIDSSDLSFFLSHVPSPKTETRKRLAKIVLVFVGLFALCWFPNHVLYMYRSFNYRQIDSSLLHLIITLVARVLSFSSSCVNPFALYLLSESFRRHFNNQLMCRRRKYQARNSSYLQSTTAMRMTSIRKSIPAVANGHGQKTFSVWSQNCSALVY